MKKITNLLLFLLCANVVVGQFGPENDISISFVSPMNSKSIDIDSDGDNDFFTIATVDNKIIWCENLGLGNFSSPKIITDKAFGVSDIDLGDIDNDGDADIAAVLYGVNKVVWYENLGGGIFSLENILITNINNPIFVNISDIDNDGDNDIISGSPYSNNIIYNKNLNNGVFDSSQTITNSVNNLKFILISDIDGDGYDDAISGNINSVKWFKNLGGNTFDTIPQIISTTINSVMSGNSVDIDNDGDNDILTCSYQDNKVLWFENIGGGIVDTTQQIISTGINGAIKTYAFDIDLDGDSDVVAISNIDNKISWFSNLGGGVFGSENIINSNVIAPRSILSKDVDGDNIADILFTTGVINTKNKLAWHKNFGGSFGAEQLFWTGSDGAYSIDYGDLDNDGDIDVLCASSWDNKISWYKNLGGGKFDKQNILTTAANGAVCVVAVDLDMDGDIDVLYASEDDDTIGWYENQGNGNFINKPYISNLADHVIEVIPVDIDNDGDLDVISASNTTYGIRWFENQGGSYASPILIDNTTQYSDVKVVDVDGDGILDVLWAGINRLKWNKGTGGGGFWANTPTDIDYVGGPSSVYPVDIDNDGDIDVFASGETNDEIGWFKNQGGGVFGPWQIITNAADGASKVSGSDLDGDGDIDLLSSSKNDDKIAWYENQGLGVFSSQSIISSSADMANDVCSIDLDSDGDPDVLSASIYDSQVAWYENFIGSQFKYSGYTFYDINQNKLIDSNEVELPFFTVVLTPNNAYSYANSGYYLFQTDSGTHTIGVMFLNQNTLWNLTTDSINYTRKLTGINPVVDSLNFGFFPDTITTIITPSLIGGFPRCNDTVNYWVNIKNEGTTIPSGVMRLELDSDVTYISASIAPDSIVGQDIYWSYDSLFFYSDKQIKVSVLMPPFTSMGNTLTSYLYVNHIDTGNTIVYSNFDTLEQVSVCAYDPNDKQVTPEGLSSFGFISNNQELEYLIRFQNTGNDTAITVMIRDQLDEDLNWASLHSIVSSHPCQIWIEQDGEAVFEFQNIMLPDSNVDFDASQGFVKFKIQLDSNLSPLSTIHNSSEIYFDLNPAVITNTVLNTIYDCNNSHANINGTTFCLGDELQAYTNENFLFNNYLWSLDSLTSVSNDSIIWVADSVGIFNLILSINNSICNKDSLITVQVNPLPNVTVLNFNPDTLCGNGTPVTLPIGIPNGGNYSGSGVGGGNFNPAAAGVGTHSVIYTYTDTNSCVNSDSTFITVEQCVGMDDLAKDLGILIYPNPNTGLFTIEKPMELDKEVNISLLDASSRVVIDKLIPKGQQKIEMDITSYSKGVYYLQMTIGDKVYVKQILKN